MIFICFCTVAVLAGSSIAAGWQAGTASISITPRESMWMAGYASRDKPSEGKVHDLWAKAVALSDSSGNRLVIINAEVVGIRRDDRTWLEQKLKDLCGLDPEEFLINVTHTHSGPELRVDQALLYGFPEEQVEKSRQYRVFFRNALAEAAGKALSNLEPVTLEYSSGRAGFAMNRRLKTDTGYIIAPNRKGVVDHEVPVLKITAGQDKIKALLFGYSCHGTVMNLYKFCGDWPGFAQYKIEEKFPGCTAMFINGCSADQNPTPRRRLELAEQYGESIANAVEAALQAQQDSIEGPLRVRMDEVRLRFTNIPGRKELLEMKANGDRYDVRRADRLLEQLGETGKIDDSYPYMIQVIQFGDSLMLAALSGEVVVDYSLRLKNAFQDRNVWTASYSNDIMGYIPSKRILEEGGYEGGEAIRYSSLPGTWAKDTEELIIDAIREMVRVSGD